LSLTLTLASGTMRFDAGASTAKLISLTNPGSTLFIQGTQEQIATAFSAITFNNDCGGAIDLSASIESGGGIRNSYNGHYYRLVQEGVSFADALANAANLTFDGTPSGTPGYLATITSAGENDFLFTVMGGSGQNAWIGGSDQETEGDWKWITGPEAGTSFYSGVYWDGGPVNGEFSGWNESEPNQFFGDDPVMQEDYVEVYGSGFWNDIPSEPGRLNYYVVEWGGMPGDNFTTAVTITDTASLAAQSPFAAGDGSEASPYEVGTVAQLAKVGECSGEGVYFKQTADLNLTDVAFSPIGNYNKYFKGTYDGNNHKIEGFVADSYDEAVFGMVGGGNERTVIKNLTVTGGVNLVDESYAGVVASQAYNATFSNLDIDMTLVAEEYSRYIGGVAGYSDNILIEDVSVTGTLNVSNSSQRIGGLIGRGYYSQIVESTSSVVITGTDGGRIGGIAGQLYNESNLTDVTFTGSISAPDFYQVGGLVGYLESSTILRSSSTGAITSDFQWSIGGLIGEAYDINISESFASGAVNGGSSTEVGGLIGQAYNVNVTDSYASGNVTGSNRVGALYGYTESVNSSRVHATGLVTTTGANNGLFGQEGGGSSIQDSFWSPELLGVAAGTPVGGELAVTLVEAQTKATYENAGWSIGQDEVLETNVWTMCADFNDGTPFLSWAFPNACLDLQVLKPVPTVTGSGAALSALTAVPGTWDSGTTLTYTWYADGVEIAGATSGTYTPTLAQIGAQITVKVTSTKEGFVTESATSSPVGPISAAALTLKPVPTITGSGTVGAELTANPGTWDADVVLTYKWFLNGVEIAGATMATFTPTKSQIGGTISVQVTGTKTGYVTESKTSTSNKKVKALVTSVRVSFGEMAGNSWWMSDAMKSGIRKTVKANSKATNLVCVGIVKPGGTKAWMKTLGLKRAEAGCWIAKMANPKLKVSYKYVISKPTDKVQRGFTLTFNK
jgi:Lectin C-type domain/The GLUG motif